MAEQSTFDKVARHLLTQAKRAYNGHNCLYRYGCLACAAGCLIPDDKYDPSLEKQIVLCNPKDGDNAVTVVIREEGHNLKLVRELQIVPRAAKGGA